MVLTTINALDSYKINGFYFEKADADIVTNTSTGGTISTLIRKVSYKYSLKLQGLTKEELKDIQEEILKAVLLEEKVSFDTTTTGGYLNHKSITGDPEFVLDYAGVIVSENDIFYELTVPLSELDLNPYLRMGV